MSIEYRLARPDERAAAEDIAARAFGPGRYAKSAYRLREGVHADHDLTFVAVKAGRIVGAIQYWPVSIGGALCLILGPLAVEEDARGSGAGLELIRVTLPLAASKGYAAVILVGDEPYYAKVGFSRVETGAMAFPGPVNPGRFLALNLRPQEPLPRGTVQRPHLDEAPAAASAGLTQR
jgi:predicted N-acetyltransferase YhbS